LRRRLRKRLSPIDVEQEFEILGAGAPDQSSIANALRLLENAGFGNEPKLSRDSSR
jgi:hypothetical protein